MHTVIDKVINYSVGTNVVEITDSHNETNNGFKWRKRTTRVRELCVKCKYRSTYWVTKDSHPVRFSEYDISSDIQHEPEFIGGCPTQ